MVTRTPLEDEELRTILDTVNEQGPIRDRLIIHGLAFLGLRASALAHMTEDWIDFQKRRVVVPAYQPCTAGRGGTPCSECKKRLELIRADPEVADTFADPADRWAGQPNSLRARAERFRRYAARDALGKRRLERILSEHDGMWFPKSGKGHRPVPAKDGDTWDLIQKWFTTYDDLMVTRQTVGNVVTHYAQDSGIRRKVLPHEFRHTYGTRLAAMDFTAYEIRDAMGHASTKQAEDYIKMSGRRLDDAFAEKWESV